MQSAGPEALCQEQGLTSIAFRAFLLTLQRNVAGSSAEGESSAAAQNARNAQAPGCSHGHALVFARARSMQCARCLQTTCPNASGGDSK